MSQSLAVWLFLVVAFVAANLPWLSERLFFVFRTRSGHKSAWLRLLEWLVLYFVVGAIGLGLERKIMGEFHPQDWEFYAVTLALFLVFALPGFIYRFELRKLLIHR